MPGLVRTILFDLDGTLIDTEKYFRIFWPKAAACFGYSMTDEQALELRSLGRPFAPEKLREWFGEDFDYMAVREMRRRLMQEHLDKVGITLRPGVTEALTWLREQEYQIALVTATPIERAAAQLRETGIDACFTRLISATQVERGKPAPDVYLFACESLGVRPEDCYAVEDSPNGVLSAATAGTKVIMVPDQTAADEALKEKLFACIPSLKELPGALMRQKGCQRCEKDKG